MNFHKKYVKTTPHWKVISAEFLLTITDKIKTGLKGYSYEDEFVKLTTEGDLTVKRGWLWGASGPTADGPEWCGKQTRKGSCYHDAFYHISNQEIFKGDNSKFVRKLADKLLYRMLKEESSWYSWPRNYLWYLSVRAAGWRNWEQSE